MSFVRLDNENKSITGNLVELFKQEMLDHNGNKKFFPGIVLVDFDGVEQRMILFHSTLKNLIGDALKMDALNIEDSITINYLGKVEGGQGEYYHRYSLSINDEEFVSGRVVLEKDDFLRSLE